VRANEGEATLYGVYFDDTEYDYMQHLRGVGEGEGDGQLLMAPKPKPTAKATKAANQASGFGFTERTQPIDRASSSKFSLPDDVLPSTSELPLAQAYSRLNAALPSELQGLQPDMDPHLRQVLEALEDEAFVDGEEDEDAWLGELVGTGEVDSMMEVEEYEFDEWGINDDELVYPEDEEGYEREEGQSRESEEQGETSWEDRFKAFKKSEDKARAEAAAASDDEDDERGTEGGDTVSGLPTMSVIGAKKRRKGQSDASGYSMSSSSMFRNKGLSTLDEKFDRVSPFSSPLQLPSKARNSETGRMKVVSLLCADLDFFFYCLDHSFSRSPD
jgi:protein LTV1